MEQRVGYARDNGRHGDARMDSDSDSNEIITVNPSDHDGPNPWSGPNPRKQRHQKRSAKTMTEEEKYEQILRDAGFDTTDMTKQEKKSLVRVIMRSRDEAKPSRQNPAKTEADDELDEERRQNEVVEESSPAPDHGSSTSDVQSIVRDGQSQSHGYDNDQVTLPRDTSVGKKIVTGRTHDMVRVGRQNRSESKGKAMSDTGPVDSEMMVYGEKLDTQQGIGDPAGASGNPGRRARIGQSKRPVSQPKMDERPKKQRKMDQYSHVIIDLDSSPDQSPAMETEPNKSVPATAKVSSHEKEKSDREKSSAKLLKAVMEDDDTQPPGSPDIFQMESSEDEETNGKGISRLEGETTGDCNAVNSQHSHGSDQEEQTTPKDEEFVESVDHRSLLAERKTPPSVDDEVHDLRHQTSHKELDISKDDGPNTVDSKASVKSSGCGGVPADTTVPFSFSSLKKKVIVMAHKVQNTFKQQRTPENCGADSDGSQKSREVWSVSQQNEYYNVPGLRRHYRKARKGRHSYPFYAPDLQSVPSYTKVIVQLMEIYSRKLREAQAKAEEMIAWGESVKYGRHVEKTVDFAPLNRAKQVVYKEVIEEEKEDVMPSKPSATTSRRCMRNRAKPIDDSDYLPDLELKQIYEMNTQPFGDVTDAQMFDVNVEKHVEAKIDGSDKFPPYKPRTRSRNAVNIDNTEAVHQDLDGWMSVDKKQNQPPLQRRQKSSDEKSTGKQEESKMVNVLAHTRTKEVQPSRRTIYTDIPANPGAVRKEEESVFDFSEDNGGEDFLALKKTGTNYQKRRGLSGRGRGGKSLTKPSLERSDSGDAISIETIPSDDDEDGINGKKSFMRENPSGAPSPSSVLSESSRESFSQQSAVMFDPQGELYSTQMCRQRERSAQKTRKPAPKRKLKDSSADDFEEEEENMKRNAGKKRGRKPKQKECNDTSSTKISSQDGSSDKSNDSPQTQDYAMQDKIEEELPVLREEPTLVDDIIDVSPTQDEEDQSNMEVNRMDSQSPDFKKGRSARKKKLKVTSYDSDEHDAEISFKDSQQQYLGEVLGTPTVQRPDHPYERPLIHGREAHYHQKEPTQKIVNIIELVPCPLCSIPFPTDQIEAHAAECEGGVPDSFPGAIQNDRSRHEEEEDFNAASRIPDNVQMTFFQSSQSPRQLNSPSPQKRHITKTSDHARAETSNESPIGPQVLMCYVCDEEFPKGQVYDQHVQECLERAKNRQLEADTHGYAGSRTSAPATPDKRSTRSKVKDEQSSRLLDRLDQAWEQTEGYTSATDESCTLQNIIKRGPGKENIRRFLQKPTSIIESNSGDSYSDEYAESSSSEWDQSQDSQPQDSQSQCSTNKSSQSQNRTNRIGQTQQTTNKVNQSNALPGNWSLEELMNSPLKTFVPINAQDESEGFVNQFANAKRRFENRAQKKPRGQGRAKQKRKRRRKRKSTAKKPAAKRRKTNNAGIVHMS